jgi:two-component system, NtrC family, response regulator GlrR
MSAHSVEETVDSTRQKANTPGGPAAGIKARLMCAFPPDLAITIDLGPDRTVLGRLPDDRASPPINHPTVSRAHYVIEWDKTQGVHLGRDLGSRNGSAVDGTKSSGRWQALGPGSVLRIGDVLLVYETGHTFDHADPNEVSRRAVPGGAMAIRKLRTQLARSAPDLSPVLIIGETGTGKELIAQEIHRVSQRKGDFVAINCATLGEQLIESQLFGHVKGSFTGATHDSPGLFRAAEGGTLFLDEIGELPRELQPKLLRAIQEREVRAVGSPKSDKVDVRVVAATHQNLAAKARSGEFRQDLYARLAMWELHVPAIRERRADVLSWLQYLHELWTEERKLAPVEVRFHAEAAEALVLAPWPENLRGLNRLVHEIASQRLTEVRVEHLPSWVNA